MWVYGFVVLEFQGLGLRHLGCLLPGNSMVEVAALERNLN